MLRIACLLLLLTVPVAASADVSASATSYHAVAATASARLTYGGGNGTNSRASGFAEVRTSLRAVARRRSHGSLSVRGGNVRFPVTLTANERATIGERSGPSSPYVEQVCRDRSKRSSTGGLTLKRLSGARVQVIWAFPHARMTACPGPRRAGGKLQGRMSRVLPASRFQAGRVVVTLAGTARFVEGRYRGTYRWRATVTLVRS
ncbi:MAG: hypothetical protein H0U03_12165 [Actinobacteria bacterium]|nr:hypothetical protein [Actinomycetota bacterium]